MPYSHKDKTGNDIALPAGKVICIGRNYLDHIAEMNSVVSEEPLLFMKPSAALCSLLQPLIIPIDKGECHNELEVSVLLKSSLKNASEEEVLDAIWGIGLGLDLTLRDVQAKLKADGQPWERAKAFDGSAPLSPFVPIEQIDALDDLHFTLFINDKTRQQGHTAMMLHKILPQIAHMSHVFTLDAGDVVLTGTPKGVGPLYAGDKIKVELKQHLSFETKVISE